MKTTRGRQRIKEEEKKNHKEEIHILRASCYTARALPAVGRLLNRCALCAADVDERVCRTLQFGRSERAPRRVVQAPAATAEVATNVHSGGGHVFSAHLYWCVCGYR